MPMYRSVIHFSNNLPVHIKLINELDYFYSKMIQEINNYKPDIIYIENQLLGIEATNVTQSIKNAYPDIPIVLFGDDDLPENYYKGDFLITYPFTRAAYKEKLDGPIHQIHEKNITKSYMDLEKKLVKKSGIPLKTKI